MNYNEMIKNAFAMVGPGDQIVYGIIMAVDESHAAQVKAGWWTDLETGGRKERDTLELFALIHSELSEALEAHRKKDRMDDKLPHRKGVEVELADTVIRLFDFLGSCGKAVVNEFSLLVAKFAAAKEDDVILLSYNFSRQISMLHARVCVIAQTFDDCMEEEAIYLSAYFFRGIVEISKERGLDLYGAYLEKSNYNAKRNDHKIEHRKGEEGKGY